MSEYSLGRAGWGVSVLKDGRQMTPEEIVKELRLGHEAVKFTANIANNPMDECGECTTQSFLAQDANDILYLMEYEGVKTYNEKDRTLILNMCGNELEKFKKWFSELNHVAGDKYGPKSLEEETGIHCWMDAFTHGLTPKEAIEQDIREGE